MSLQKIYNKVRKHLLKQGQKSSEGSSCLYRGPDGLRCAIGCLITNKAYAPNIEHQVPRSSAVKNALRASGIPTDSRTLDLLGVLQQVHDNYKPSRWESKLNAVAKTFGLEVQ